ncbi:MAG: IS110 family transposase [Chlorobi bacterium]|nr:IS110 family transposase [Chlorobiota bacterium]
MYYTGIDQHKRTSYLTTVDSKGIIIQQANLKNTCHDILNYFNSIKGKHQATVETTVGWYWMSDLLESQNIPLLLAHAKYVKAIAYAKVKTDKVDSQILAQLLRMNFIPEAHKIPNHMRPLRDTLRARLRLSQKRTSSINFMHRMLEKFNVNDSSELDEYYLLQYQQFDQQEKFLKKQMLILEKSLYPKLIPDEDIQRILWIPGIGKMNAFTLHLEIGNINRFPSVNNFFSYCRLVPAASNSGGKSKQRSSKDGNKYLKIVFSDAAVHAVQYYPVIKKYYNSLLRKKNKQIAKSIIAKEIARIVYYVLKTKENYNNKSIQWQRVLSPDV